MPQTLRTYGPAWYAKMVEIWEDRLSYYAVHRTGALRRSVTGARLTARDLTMTAEFRFLRYGIHVDSGRGPASPSGHVERRPWFSRSWRISLHVLARAAARAAGQLYIDAFQILRK